jgi:hypothetical protein
MHGTVSGTDHLEVSPDGSRIYLASGQVLRTGSFIQAASIGAGVPRFGDSGNVVYVLDKFGVIGVYDTTTFLKVDEVNLPCSFASVKQLLVLPSGSGWLGLGDDLVCGLVRGVPTMTPFELERVSLSFEGPGMDEFRFSARFVLAESSDGIDPESEAVQVSFGQYCEPRRNLREYWKRSREGDHTTSGKTEI